MLLAHVSVRLAQAAPGVTDEGIAALTYGGGAIGPGIGIGTVVGNAITGHGPSARGRRHGAHHHVPRHRLHRGARPVRLRPRSSSSRALRDGEPCDATHPTAPRSSRDRLRRTLRLRRRGYGRSRPEGCERPVARRRGGQARGRGERRHRGRRRVHRDPRRGRHGRRLPGGTEPDPAGDRTSSSGVPSRSSCSSSSSWKFGVPRPQEGHGRPHRADPRRPRRGRGGQGPRPRPSSPSTRASWPTPSNESARIIEEARQTADAMKADLQARRQTRARRDCASGRPPTSRRPRRRPSPTSAARWPTLAIGAAEQVVEPQPRPGHQHRARRGLHQPGRGVATDGRRRAHRRLRRGAARGRPGRGRRSARSRTSCSASPASSRATTSCATRSPTRTSPSARASRSSRTCSAARPTPTTIGLVSMVVGTGRVRDLPADRRRRWWRAQRRGGQQGGGRGPLGHPAHRRPEGPPRRGPRPGHRQEGRGQGHHRPVGAGRPRRPGRRHGHRRLGPAPPRAARRPRSEHPHARPDAHRARNTDEHG